MTVIDSGTVCVEDCQQIDYLDISHRACAKLLDALITAEIETLGFRLSRTTSKTGNGGTRGWFKCPLCGRRIRVALVHPISRVVGCRACLSLKYRCQRYKGMPEAL